MTLEELRLVYSGLEGLVIIRLLAVVILELFIKSVQ